MAMACTFPCAMGIIAIAAAPAVPPVQRRAKQMSTGLAKLGDRSLEHCFSSLSGIDYQEHTIDPPPETAASVTANTGGLSKVAKSIFSISHSAR